MSQEIGSQQLLLSANSLPRDTCNKMSDHCIDSSVADVPKQRTPVSASQTYHSSVDRPAGSTLSLRRLEPAVRRWTNPRSLHTTCLSDRISLFSSSTCFRRPASSVTRFDCWSRPRKRSTSLCRVSRCSVCTQFRGNLVVQHLPRPTRHEEAQALENVHGVTQVVTVTPLA